jgi:nucleoside-diphosphate-sugar epimerase
MEYDGVSMQPEMRLLITGSTGFIGKKLTEKIQGSGSEVIEIPQDLDLEEDDKTSEFITSIDPTHVIHLANNRKHERESSIEEHQFQVSRVDLNVTTACQRLKNLNRFITIGTCDEYGRQEEPFLETALAKPTNAYGKSKLALTQLLMEISEKNKFPSVILRPSVVYGANQLPDMFISSLFVAMLEQRKIPLTPGNQTRDFIHVDDVVEAITLSLKVENIPYGSIFNIATQRAITIREVAMMIADLFGSKHKSLLEFGALEYRPSEVMNYRVNAEKATRLLSWNSNIRLEDGLSSLKELFTRGA